MASEMNRSIVLVALLGACGGGGGSDVDAPPGGPDSRRGDASAGPDGAGPDGAGLDGAGPDAPRSPDGARPADAAPPPPDASPPDATPTVTLTVTKGGAGSGTVSGAVECGPGCTSTSVSVAMGTSVSLVAFGTNGADSYFTGWGGACASQGIQRGCTLTVTAATTVSASFAIQPANLAFVTSTAHPGSSGSLAVFDAACNARATEAGINTAASDGFVAWMSSSTESAVTRLGSARGWVRLDGRPAGDEIGEMLGSNGQIFYPPAALDDLGRDRINGNMIFTGTTAAGGLSGTCGDWTATTGDGGGAEIGGGPSAWTGEAGPPCSLSLPVLCLGVTHTTAVAPTPVPGKKIWVTSVSYEVGTSTPDAFCQAHRPGGVTTAHAVIGTSTASAASRLAASTTYVRPDGVAIGTGAALAAGVGMLANAWQDEGGVYGPQQFYSGGHDPGVLGVHTCADWTSTASTGDTSYTGRTWVASGWPFFTFTCTIDLPLLCAED